MSDAFREQWASWDAVHSKPVEKAPNTGVPFPLTDEDEGNPGPGKDPYFASIPIPKGIPQDRGGDVPDPNDTPLKGNG